MPSVGNEDAARLANLRNTAPAQRTTAAALPGLDSGKKALLLFTISAAVPSISLFFTPEPRGV